jgi:AcrR family transcriptional regulator
MRRSLRFVFFTVALNGGASVYMPKATPRADAQRNRERLLAAASDAFRGADRQVTLEAVAKRAGVGIGTLYRHFPTREALVEAVYRNELDRLVTAGEELLAAEPPDVALRAWMDAFADWVEAKRGMIESLRAMISAGAIERSDMQAQMGAVIDAFLRAGAAQGLLRDDVEAADVLRSLTGLLSTRGAGANRAQLDRTLDILIDGLRFNAG